MDDRDNPDRSIWPCPRCERMLVVIGRTEGEPLDLLPLCTDLDGCGWTGAVTDDAEMCDACGDEIPAGEVVICTYDRGEYKNNVVYVCTHSIL